MPLNKIYLDYAATTPTDKKVFKKMLPFFSEKFGNPMTLYDLGVEASDAVEEAREKAALFLDALPQEIIFTSGATESNNLAIKGAVYHYYQYFRSEDSSVLKPHVITTQFEHKSVLATVKSLEKKGIIEASYIAPDKDGIVKLKSLEKAVLPNTVLVSVMYVNNEVGTIQPISQIGKIIKKINRSRPPQEQILFHSDAVQAANYLDCSVKKLKVDMLSLSGHKIYGPKGVGILYKKTGVNLVPLLNGGAQESGLRPGTHNVPAIVGMGEAISLLKTSSRKKANQKIKELRDYLVKRVLKEIPGSYLNGSLSQRIPNNANFRFDSVEGESLLMSLDMEGIAVGSGSACSSKDLRPSHVLLSLGLKPEQSHGSLRIALGKETTKKEIDFTFKILKRTIRRLRQISGDILEEFKK